MWDDTHRRVIALRVDTINSPSHRNFSFGIRLDLKPENVLICLDDVESIIQSELANSASAGPAPTKLVGVPPSRGRGGNQTPRAESIYITGSQPLPSPSSSYGSSPMLDKWAFGMSKIDNDTSGSSKSKSKEDGDGLRPSLSSSSTNDPTDQAIEGIGNVSLDSQPAHKLGPGPSLLTQQAPPPGSQDRSGARTSSPQKAAGPSSLMEGSYNSTPLSTSAMSVDDPALLSNMDSGSSESRMSGTNDLINMSERITVKIADLGNGKPPSLYNSSVYRCRLLQTICI